ncbi:MAG: hypothetical protein KatS3mg031_0128 [Chitinophagales bacterium]|nr:MAG: hypothetical protein KatS3mg031_0128 [Chitinophagales bacterium]
MQKLMQAVFFIALLLLLHTDLRAQLDIPRPSPLGRLSQEVGLNEITIEYSRPGVKGRVIFGDLVPYGKLWRTGANAATKIILKDDAKFEGLDIPKGEYSLLTIPGETEWTIIINKDATASVRTYDQAKDQVRFKVKPQRINDKVETMTFLISNVKMDQADIELMWENTKVSFKMTTEVDSKVMKQIEEAMKGISPATYYRAASYYFETGKDLNKALEWVNKALESEQKFWMLHTKAKIQAALGDYKGAIETAKKSKELAIKENNDDFVALNDKLIAELSKKK